MLGLAVRLPGPRVSNEEARGGGQRERPPPRGRRRRRHPKRDHRPRWRTRPPGSSPPGERPDPRYRPPTDRLQPGLRPHGAQRSDATCSRAGTWLLLRATAANEHERCGARSKIVHRGAGNRPLNSADATGRRLPVHGSARFSLSFHRRTTPVRPVHRDRPDNAITGLTCGFVAEDAGFEPARVLPQHDFQHCALLYRVVRVGPPSTATGVPTSMDRAGPG